MTVKQAVSHRPRRDRLLWVALAGGAVVGVCGLAAYVFAVRTRHLGRGAAEEKLMAGVQPEPEEAPLRGLNMEWSGPKVIPEE